MNVRLGTVTLAVSLAALVVQATPAVAQPPGRACNLREPCGNGFSCQPGEQKCYNAPRLDGQPCAPPFFKCGGGLRCAAGVPGTQHCVSASAPPTGAIEKAAAATGSAATTAASAVGGAVKHEAATVAAAMPSSCPDMQMRCPTGEPFARGTSWDPSRAMCRPSRTMEATLQGKCPSAWVGQRKGTTDLNALWWAKARQATACSAPGKALETVDSELFNDACIIHDLCYRSRMSKAACDGNFWENQKAVCFKLGVPARLGAAACLQQAALNFDAVLVGGQSSYDAAQRVFGQKP